MSTTFSVLTNAHTQHVDGSAYRLLAVVSDHRTDEPKIPTPEGWDARWRELSSGLTVDELSEYRLPGSGIADFHHPRGVDLKALAAPALERGYALARYKVVRNPYTIDVQTLPVR